jgi:hypothetical protein
MSPRPFLLTAAAVCVVAVACDAQRYSLGRPHNGLGQGGNAGTPSGAAGVGIGDAGTAGAAGAGGRDGNAGKPGGGTTGDAGATAGFGGANVGGSTFGGSTFGGFGGGGFGGTSLNAGEGGEGDPMAGGIGGTLGGTGGSAVGEAGTGAGGRDLLTACMGGTFGSAGSASGCPACRGGTNVVSGCVLQGDALAEDSVRETVTVISIEDVIGHSCPYPFDDGPQATSRLIVLQADDTRRWSIFVRVPELPTNIVAVSDSLELAIDFDEGSFIWRPGQAVSLSQNGAPIVVAFTGSDRMGPLLAEHGIEIARLGRICEVPGCGWEDVRARVKVGASEAVFDPGETRQVENLRLTIDQHNERSPGGGGCDAGGTLRGAGFAVPNSR